MKKNFLFIMSFLLYASIGFAIPTYTGDGNIATPYLIDTCLELQDMNAHLGEKTTNTYFKLDANIDCSVTSTWVIGPGQTKLRGFDPIGKFTSSGSPYPLAFQANFDGNNMTIKNLMIWSDVNQHQGLFGYTYDANIKNV